VNVLGERDRSAIAEVFATLERDVALRLDLGPGPRLATVVHGIAAAGRSEPGLSGESLTQLAALDRDVALDVFVTPT
jgi:hypothetical protein